ncbi:MAG: alanine--tRNA ligase [Elusimicrobiota bacterium]|jgi:alanyl-tRNA synthetase|nr:alanine--tRNA ligase [Elusimicrobiota bacterium]
MKKTSSQIRREFLDFFKKNGAEIVPSDSLIPSGDSTLLFTSAGMVQFKQHFLGQSKDAFTRAASCQKCFRTSDIEQIGQTTRHLTFFEMLGNFSFGDYFKKESINWGWEFLTKNMSLPIDKLYITVYKDDDEAEEIWKKIVPASRITRMGEDTNFWNMGDTGPCGPCSEIYIDLGQDCGCGKPTCSVGCDCDRYLEIWNHVFTQFDKQPGGSLKPLPRKNIDTGMGLERLVAAANGQKSIFNTDLFMPIMEAAASILKIKPDKNNTVQLRMIADHCRAVTFLISDGILPSNEGRGYVLRRILRRALRTGKILGHSEPFLNELSSAVFKIMEPAYPELSAKLSNIKSIISVEEEKFLETLQSGSDILFQMIDSYKSKKAQIISGEDVFKLHDTYGFPFDLTKEIALENGLDIDGEGFKRRQAEAQEKSRASWEGSGEKDIAFYSAIHKKAGDTVFEGYDKNGVEGGVLSLIKDGIEVQTLNAGETGEIVLSKTSFYAESGGQIGDIGILENNLFKAEVLGVFKPIGSLFVHKIKVLSGSVKAKDIVKTVFDFQTRRQTARHHTCVHLLQAVLREIFGSHITQAGSLVSNNYLRFDFTHFAPIKREDLFAIERKVNAAIMENMPVIVKTMPISEARSAGAMALFGEKYGETVRTISIKNNQNNSVFSMELCGGTHVERSGDIGFFKIISESSIGAQTRRIEAMAGLAACDYIDAQERQILQTAEFLNAGGKDVFFEKVKKNAASVKELENQINVLKSRQFLSDIDSYLKEVQNIKGFNFAPILVKDADIKSLRDLSDKIKEKLTSAVIILVSQSQEKVSFIVSVTKDYVQKGIDAGKIAKSFAADINGSGGGKADFAQGGGKEISKVEKALKEAGKHMFIIVASILVEKALNEAGKHI